jgi:hypothetical protein
VINERINIRRLSTGTAVSVTQKVDGHVVHWQVRVLGPTAALVAAAIKECRAKCSMLLDGIEDAEEVGV